MTWREQLKQASFRGIPFFVEGSDMGFGRRNIGHEYVYRDVPFSEDLGKKARSFSIQAYVFGDDYLEQMDRLIEAIEGNATPGTLIHPTKGSMLVVPGECRRMFSNQEGGREFLDLTFSQAGQNQYPEKSLTSGSKVKETATTAREALNTVFESVFDASSKPQYIPDDAATVSDSFVSKVQSLLQGATPTVTGGAAITAALQPLIDDAPSLLQTASSWASQIQTVAVAIRDAFTDPRHIYKVAKGLLSFGDTFTPIIEVTSNRTLQKTNRDAQTSLVRSHALAVMAESTADMTFDSYNTAVAYRDELSTAMDDEVLILGNTDNDQAVLVLEELRADMVGDITTRSANLKRVKTIQRNETVPAVVLAYDLFGSGEAESDIITRNNIMRPGSVPAGVPIEVLA